MIRAFAIFACTLALVLAGSIPASAQQARIDAESAGLSTKIAPGEELPISVKLVNFENRNRIDVQIAYEIVSKGETVVYSGHETVAVETTASFVKKIPLPPNLPQGVYRARTSLTYEDQIVPATSEFSFTVERKIFGIFQRTFIIYAICVFLGSLILLSRGRTMYRRYRNARFARLDYSDVPHDVRTFYEIVSDTIYQMRQRVGEDAVLIAAHVDGLEINLDTGRVQALNKPPAKIISSLVQQYETFLGKKVSISFRRKKSKK